MAALMMASCANGDMAKDVYYNAKIYTAEKDMPEATAMVVEDGKIVYVGNDEEALKMVGNKAQQHDINGKRIVPGFFDSHNHFIILSNSACGVPMLTLSMDYSHEEVLQKVKEFAEKNPDLKFIWGMGWGTKAQPTLATELDKLGLKIPVILADQDGHTYWVNSVALEQAGVDKNTPDLVPGASYFERDAEGNPNGVVREPAQCAWLGKKLQLFTKDMMKKGMPVVAQKFNELGVTSVVDCGVLNADDEVGLQAAKEWEDPTLRIYGCVMYNYIESVDEYAARAEKAIKNFNTEMLRTNTLKAYKDGTTDAGTALVFKPYNADFPGKAGTYGNCMISNEKLEALARKAADMGMNIHVHTIGDKAISDALDVMEKLGPIEGTKTLAHVELLTGGAYEKFIKNKDVICSTTPVWDKEELLGRTRKYMGDEDYFKYHMPMKDMLDNGIKITFGSDIPASKEGFNPLKNIWAAACEGIDSAMIWRPGKNMTIAECVDAATIKAAEQVRAEDEVGSIKAGKWADFVILNEDIFSIDPKKIKDVTVDKTFLKGRSVYSSDK